MKAMKKGLSTIIRETYEFLLKDLGEKWCFFFIVEWGYLSPRIVDGGISIQEERKILVWCCGSISVVWFHNPSILLLLVFIWIEKK